jgi:glycosyltransferase involved in cell wall biosynthesis
MRIYPIYSAHLRISLEKAIGKTVSVITTNCMCYDKDDPVDRNVYFVGLPYVTIRPSKTKLKSFARLQLHNIMEPVRGRLFSRTTKDFDIAHFQQSSYAFGYPSLKAFLSSPSQSKRVVTIHKLDPVQNEKPELNAIYNKADAVITFSEFMRSALIDRGVQPKKVFVVPHGVPLSQQNGTKVESAIMFCGSPIPGVKGFEHLVVALRLLKEESISLKVKIHGFYMPNEIAYARELAVDNGIEELFEWMHVGSEEELISHYQDSILCLIPYTGYAGYFPASYALAAGTPTVATDVLGHSEYVGDAGLMVEPGSPERLADGIKRILLDDRLRKQLGTIGRKKAEENHAWETVAGRTIEVYKRALEGN